MDQRVELVIDPLRKESVSVTLPLTFRVPVEAAARELDLPNYVDLADPIVAKAVALANAARRWDPPVRFAVFGGTAHRLRCPVSNDGASGLRHELHDLDLAITVKEVRPFERFLTEVSATEGSGLTFFETSGDRIFNALSGGQRLRWHMVVEQRGSEVVLGTLDLVADAFNFCHRIDVRTDVEAAASHGWTLAPVHLLLTKGQFVQRIAEEDSAGVRERILEPFGRHDVLIGPEAKDVRDILALLHDHSVGEGPDDISAAELTRCLAGDWGLWKTFVLNLAMVRRSSVLTGLTESRRARILSQLDHIDRLVAGLAPKRRFGFLGGPWWQEVDSTPSVDSTVHVG